MVRAITFRSGCIFFRAPVVSIPFFTGIFISINTTSGIIFFVSNSFKNSSPLKQVMITSKSELTEIIFSSALETSLWSSTIAILIFSIIFFRYSTVISVPLFSCDFILKSALMILALFAILFNPLPS